MRKLVDQAPIPKDASSSLDDGFKHTYQARKPGNTTTDRESMNLVAYPKTKPGGTTGSVESVAPPQGKK